MRRIRFTTGGLILFVAAAALLGAAMRDALRHGDGGEFLGTTILVLLGAFALAVFRKGRVRSFCGGFVLAGVGYLALTVVYGFRSDASGGDYWPTTRFFHQVFDAVSSSPSSSAAGNVGFAEAGWRHRLDEQRLNTFLLAAHSVTSLVFGVLGGMAAVALLRRQDDRFKAFADRADALIASDAQDEPIGKLRLS